MAIRKQKKMPMYSEKQAQIKAQVRALLFNKVFTEILTEYSDYIDVFLAEYAVELLENTELNEHNIKQEKSKQLPFGPIYSLRLVELETFI